MTQTRPLDYRELPAYKPLFLDYLHRHDAVADFFAGDPSLESSWRKVAERLDASTHAPSSIAAPLRRLNASLDADARALASLDALADGALAVVTGQQVGLFGGPLYTIYKALSAVRLANHASELLGRPVVPLFWMDTDDHDFEEVRDAKILAAGQQLARLRYGSEDADPAERLPVGARELTAQIEAVHEEAAAALPESEFKQEILAALRDCYAPGRTMAEAFGRWLLRLSRDSGLAVVDPSLPELKQVGARLFEREIADGSESSRLVAATTDDLVSRGYHAQAQPAESGVNLFVADPRREPVQSPPSDDARDELIARVRSEPFRFSANVLLRPLYQDTLFPTLAYVAGPSELAYFAQLSKVYAHFEVTMPLVVSRFSATVVERPQTRFLERYAVEPARLSANDESVLNEILRTLAPPKLDEDLERARRCIEDITQSLEGDLAAVDSSLVPTVKSTRGKLLHHLKELESKALKAVKRKNDTVRQQFLATRSALFPDFSMQERSVTALGFLNKYGWHFSSIVGETIEPLPTTHTLIEP